MTVPFGSFEEALKDEANKDVARRLQDAVKAIPSTAAEPKLAECREIAMEVTACRAALPTGCSAALGRGPALRLLHRQRHGKT